MRLYTTTGATQVDDPDYGAFNPDANGAFEFPDPVAAKLHGRPGWETDSARTTRIATEELDRLRDPATLLAEMRKMGDGQGALTALLAQALGLAPPAVEAEAAAKSAVAPQSEGKSEPETAPEGAKSMPTRGRPSKAAKTAVSDAP